MYPAEAITFLALSSISIVLSKSSPFTTFIVQVPHRSTIQTVMHSTLDSRLEIEAEAIGQAVNSFHSPFLSPKSQSPHDDHLNKNTALIILNSPIENPPSPIFTKLWEISSIRICADGGANRLYHSTRDIDNAYIPDLIRGDLDSLDPAVRQHYETLGCAVERDADQKFNDLDKALCAIRDRQNRDADLNVSDDILSPVHVYVYGAFGGRFDQEMASIQALYRWKDESMKIALYTDETCAFLLKPNVKNLILLPFHSGNIDSDDNNGDIVKVGEGPTCGLIPIGCRCDGVETEGFKWNLDGSVPLEFGGLVSTSNHAEEDTLIVRCSQPLVFTAEMVQR